MKLIRRCKVLVIYGDWETVRQVKPYYVMVTLPLCMTCARLLESETNIAVTTTFLTILTGKVAFYSIQYKNLLKKKLGCFWTFSYVYPAINFYTFYCRILKNADVWKMWFIKQTEMNGCFLQHLRKVYRKISFCFS